MTEAVATNGEANRDLIAAPRPQSLEAYRTDFDRLASARKSEPAWLAQFRTKAMHSFESLGFPTMKNEDWHFTSVAPIANRVFHPAAKANVGADVVARLMFAKLNGPMLVFVNGFFDAALSSDTRIEGLSVTSLADAIRTDSAGDLRAQLGAAANSDNNAFTALNSAFFRDGALVRIGADVVVDEPIQLVFVATETEGAVCHPRNVIVADRHSKSTVIESFLSHGHGTYFSNSVTEILLADGARLSHYKLQSECKKAFHVGTIQARQMSSSYYESFSFATGADLSRTNVYTVLQGDAAECVMNGLYMADGTQHMDHQTFIEHVAPNCPSHELYKGILDGRSHGVFNGKVYVHPEAQKTDGKQSNNNLLLSDHARVDTKPQLEIFADDVKCTHGATVGRLDDTALFYLRSRGIGMALARRLLTYAFAADVLERLALAPLREALEARLLRRFTAA